MLHVQTSAHISQIGIPNATDAHLSRLGRTESCAHVTSLGPVSSQLRNTQRDHVTSLGQAILSTYLYKSKVAAVTLDSTFYLPRLPQVAKGKPENKKNSTSSYLTLISSNPDKTTVYASSRQQKEETP